MGKSPNDIFLTKPLLQTANISQFCRKNAYLAALI